MTEGDDMADTVTWQAQISTWTANNRYPGIFRTAQARIAEQHGSDLGSAGLKILSFGCSTGSELSTLRAYFPDALLHGCDVNPAALQDAAESLLQDEAVLFESTPDAIAQHGPFDIIFAMSVLCRFPDSMAPGCTTLDPVFPHAAFQATVQTLADNLAPHGLLCLYNTSYDARALMLAAGFGIVDSPLIGGNGFVDRFGDDGRRATRCEKLGPWYVHLPLGDASRHDFTACIFENSAPDRQIPFTAAPPPPRAPEFYRFGPDPMQASQAGLISTALGYWFEPGALLRAWYRTDADGTIHAGPAWEVAATDAARAVLTGDWRRQLPPSPAPPRTRRMLHALRSGGARLQGLIRP